MYMATIIGNLTKDPELYKTSGGAEYARFVVAVNSPDERVDYISVAVFNAYRDAIVKNLHKGSKVCCVGTMHVELYESENGAYVNQNMVSNSVEFLANWGNAEPDANASGKSKSAYTRKR